MNARPVVQVGFVGLGDQGAPMARAIAEAGWSLHVWARRPRSLDAVAGLAHTVADDLVGLGRACDLVGLCLGDDRDVEQVLVTGGLLESMAPGGIVANHGTGSPEASEALAARARRHGVFVLDAPVSGGGAGARDHSLTVMAGGDRDAYERARPVFESFGAAIAYLGAAGSGQVAKLVNNALYAANLKNAGDMLALADAFGLEVPLMVDLVLASSGSSFALDALARRIPLDLAEHAQALVRKDVGHLSEVARRRGIAVADLEETARRGVHSVVPAVRRLTQP
ncbi:MAG TPA: NAD(P)-dependent oxidoreductase [Acidimicrobiales bacterium]|nr:NAD(P)-dependent oxidoreductase [Acidimicrobiales bacterium]